MRLCASPARICALAFSKWCKSVSSCASSALSLCLCGCLRKRGTLSRPLLVSDKSQITNHKSRIRTRKSRMRNLGTPMTNRRSQLAAPHDERPPLDQCRVCAVATCTLRHLGARLATVCLSLFVAHCFSLPNWRHFMPARQIAREAPFASADQTARPLDQRHWFRVVSCCSRSLSARAQETSAEA